MPTNNNAEISRKLRDGLKINQATESVPTRVAESIVPVFEVAPDKVIQHAWAQLNDAELVAIHTTHATRRTFLIGMEVSVAKDVINAGEYTTLMLTPARGSIGFACLIQYLSLTAGAFDKNIMLPYPLEIEKGTDISLANGGGLGSIDATGIIYFYEED